MILELLFLHRLLKNHFSNKGKYTSALGDFLRTALADTAKAGTAINR
jgi:hypothetical protein